MDVLEGTVGSNDNKLRDMQSFRYVNTRLRRALKVLISAIKPKSK